MSILSVDKEKIYYNQDTIKEIIATDLGIINEIDPKKINLRVNLSSKNGKSHMEDSPIVTVRSLTAFAVLPNKTLEIDISKKNLKLLLAQKLEVDHQDLSIEINYNDGQHGNSTELSSVEVVVKKQVPKLKI